MNAEDYATDAAMDAEVIRQGEFERSFRIICAWCRGVLQDGSAGESHGICRVCKEKLEEIGGKRTGNTYETMRYWDQKLTQALEANDRKRIGYCRLQFLAARETHLKAESAQLAEQRAEASV